MIYVIIFNEACNLAFQQIKEKGIKWFLKKKYEEILNAKTIKTIIKSISCVQ